MVQPFNIHNMPSEFPSSDVSILEVNLNLQIHSCCHNSFVTGLITPMGITMGHGIMPPIGVPPPGMQGMLVPPGGPMMAQQMLQQGVNVPFSSARKFTEDMSFESVILAT